MAQREIPDSEDDSPIDPVRPDEAFSLQEQAGASRSPSVTRTPSNPAPNIALRGVTQPSEKPPSPSPRKLELQRKITQLRSTITHTETQLGETLDNLSTLASFQQQGSTESPLKLPFESLNATRNLSQDQQRTLSQAQQILDRHIKQLGQYNQLKDIAMGMLGMIAEKEGKTLRDVMNARDVEDDD